MTTIKLNQKAINIIIAVFVLIGVITVSVCITLSVTDSSHDNSSAVDDTFETYNMAAQEWVGNQQTYTGEKNTDYISIPGFDFLNFKAGTENQAVNFYNPPANNCFFIISLILNNEILWQSPLLAPGKAVYNIEMNNSLETGEYNATLKYECFADVEARTELNGSEVGLVLKVLK